MNKIAKLYYRHRKFCLMAMTLVIVAIGFAVPNVALAQAADTETTQLMQSINEIVNYIIRFSSAWLWPVLVMIGSLLDNDLIFSGAMGERLLGIWVQIRNLVNIAFVLVLLAVAVYNVLGIGEEGGPFALKQVLPKFVLALIAVNFSFLAIKVVLDFTNVITGAVFTLPATISDQPFSSKDIETTICGPSSNEMPMRLLWCEKQKFNDRATALFSKLDRSNIALVYAIKFGKAPNWKFIKDGLKDLGQLGFNILFNMVLYVVYALSFIALLLVLLSRVVVLWIAVVLSPLLALSIVVPQLKELGGGGGELQQKVVKSAIAPITIGLVLSVGYIMIDGFNVDKNIHGALLSSSTLGAIDPNAIPTDIGDLQQLMVAIGVVVIVWVGVFGAAKDTVAGTVTEMIRSKAVDFGKFAAKLPTYLQAIPTGGKLGRDRISLGSIFKTIGQIPQEAERRFAPSIFEGMPPSGEVLAEWRNARNMKDFAKSFAKNPNVLDTDEGFSIFRTAMINFKKIKAEDFDKKYPNRGYHENAVRDLLAQDREFQSGLQGTSLERANADRIIAAIKQKPAAPVTDAKSASKAIGERGGEVLSTNPANFAGWNAVQLEQLRRLPEGLRESLITWTSDNKLQLANGIDHEKIKVLADLATALSNATDANQINVIRNQELVAANSAGTQRIDQLIDGVNYKSEDVKRSALGLKSTAPAAAAGGTPTTPPSPRQ